MSLTCFLLNKSLAKFLSEHIRFANLHTGGSTGSFMTSYLPFTDKGKLLICIQYEYSHLKQFCLIVMKVYNLYNHLS